jgi:hypothetical protein
MLSTNLNTIHPNHLKSLKTKKNIGSPTHANHTKNLDNPIYEIKIPSFLSLNQTHPYLTDPSRIGNTGGKTVSLKKASSFRGWFVR